MRWDGSVMHEKSSSVFEMRWFSLKRQLSHSSVFEMRWFRNYHRTHQCLRWDGSVGSKIIIALIGFWDEMVQYLTRVFEMRWFRIWNETGNGSIVFFESWTEMSSKNWNENLRLVITEKKNSFQKWLFRVWNGSSSSKWE